MANVLTEIGHLNPKLHASSSDNLTHWTDAELTRWYADRLRKDAQKYGTFVKRDNVSVSLITGLATYPTPPRCVDIMYVALNNVGLIAASTAEIEALDEDYATTQGTPQYWYADKQTPNVFGVYPVPDSGVNAVDLDIIYHEFHCNLDENHVDTLIDIPQPLADVHSMWVLGQAYGKQGDGQQMEVARLLDDLYMNLYSPLMMRTWGEAA